MGHPEQPAAGLRAPDRDRHRRCVVACRVGHRFADGFCLGAHYVSGHRGRLLAWPFVAASRGRRAALALFVAAVAYIGLSLSTNHIVGPVARIQAIAPDRSAAGLRRTAIELWNRNDYGVAATRMITVYPAFGVGVGAFHEMASEFGGRPLPPDNAQNWYRHQLAELGVVGSLGWMVFVGSFGWRVLRRHETEEVPASPLRGAILGLAIVSLLGMPGQDPAMAFTFWTFAAWYLLASGRPTDPRPTTRATWIVAAAIVLVFVAGTAQFATGRLRLPGTHPAAWRRLPLWLLVGRARR